MSSHLQSASVATIYVTFDLKLLSERNKISIILQQNNFVSSRCGGALQSAIALADETIWQLNSSFLLAWCVVLVLENIYLARIHNCSTLRWKRNWASLILNNQLPYDYIFHSTWPSWWIPLLLEVKHHNRNSVLVKRLLDASTY